MKCLIRTMKPACLGFFTLTLLPTLTFPGAVGADDDPSPPLSLPANAQTNGPEDWSRSRLYLESALRAQINRTNASLNDQKSDVAGTLSRLRSQGYLDRRSTSNIERALENARSTRSSMAAQMQADEPIDGWTAHMIAYELGMAGDTLAQQAASSEDRDRVTE